MKILHGEKVCKMETTWRYFTAKNGNHIKILNRESVCNMGTTWRYFTEKVTTLLELCLPRNSKASLLCIEQDVQDPKSGRISKMFMWWM
jgi:hypothetical protein